MNALIRNLSLLSTVLVAVGCSSSEEGKSSAASQAAIELYTKNCKVCHAQGLNGAPILGNKKMWAERIEQDIPTLVEHAINGYGLMPPKGGNTELTQEEIKQVVEYMVSQAK